MSKKRKGTRSSIALGLLLGLAVTLLGTFLAGSRARAALKKKYPPVGKLVDVGGYRLHIDCMGEGSPVVVMEAGFASLGLIWSPIQAKIARETRVCVYDRAGYGWSDPSPGPRTAGVMVEELHRLLQNAGIPGPYVLVGNSLGGLLVRLYAQRYPGEVAGMVLVDATHEDTFQRLPGAVNPLGRVLFRVLPYLVKTGIPALAPSLIPVHPNVSKEIAEPYRAFVAAESKFAETAAAEYLALEESLDQVRAGQVPSLGEIPLVVISHGRLDGLSARLGLLPPEQQQQALQVWQGLQGELAVRSTRGRLVIAEGVGHNIEFEKPELVVEAIREVLAVAREQPK